MSILVWLDLWCTDPSTVALNLSGMAESSSGLKLSSSIPLDVGDGAFGERSGGTILEKSGRVERGIDFFMNFMLMRSRGMGMYLNNAAT